MRIAAAALLLLLAVSGTAGATTFVVDPLGGGDFTTIGDALETASGGDTVKVLPGHYRETVNLDQNVVLMGSGFENTTIASEAQPQALLMSDGIVQWFTITSLAGDGVKFSGGLLTNCVITGCVGSGLVFGANPTGVITQCVFCMNADAGIYGVVQNNQTGVSNCIAYENGWWGYHCGQTYYYFPMSNCCAFGNAQGGFACGTDPGSISEDPDFEGDCLDVRLGQGSPCVNAGNPAMFDPDGSRSDIGYFGGPRAPIFPIVTQMTLVPLEGGGVRVEARGRANW